jgi:hypothetical protein
MLAANGYLTEQVLPAYNRRFAVAAAEAGTAFVPWIWTPLAEMLCSQEERVGAKDNTVRVHDYPHGTLVVFHGPRCLARYQPDGQLIEPDGTQLGRNGATR